MPLCFIRKHKTPTCIRGVRPNGKKKKNSLGHCATSKFWKKNIKLQGKY